MSAKKSFQQRRLELYAAFPSESAAYESDFKAVQSLLTKIADNYGSLLPDDMWNEMYPWLTPELQARG